MKIDFLLQKDAGKLDAVASILKKTGVTWPEICYVGDDIVDSGVLRRAGVAVAVADAVDEARAAADMVTAAAGGRGAVREVVEAILTAQGKWSRVVSDYAD